MQETAWILSLEISQVNTDKSAYKKNFMVPFYGWGSTASGFEPLRGGSLLFTTNFPEIPGTHFIDLRRVKKVESTLEQPSGFEHGTPGVGIQRLNH